MNFALDYATEFEVFVIFHDFGETEGSNNAIFTFIQHTCTETYKVCSSLCQCPKIQSS